MSLPLLMTCGLAFAGKTTLARRLAKRIGGRVVSLDEINEERGAGHGGEGLPGAVWAETHRIALARLDALLAGGVGAVVDDTCCYRRLRDDYREIARRHGAWTRVIVLEVPFEVIERRRAESARRGDRLPIHDEVLRSLRDTFEWPGEDENVLRFLHGEDLDTWLAEHFPPAPDRS